MFASLCLERLAKPRRVELRRQNSFGAYRLLQSAGKLADQTGHFPGLLVVNRVPSRNADAECSSALALVGRLHAALPACALARAERKLAVQVEAVQACTERSSTLDARRGAG